MMIHPRQQPEAGCCWDSVSERRMSKRIFELSMQGYCCSQIIMILGLEEIKKDSPDLIAAMNGLCNGLQIGSLCGTLTAAVCFLSLQKADQSTIENFIDWFNYEYGSLGCDEILDGNPLNRWEKCPVIVEETFEKLKDLLAL